MIRNHVRRAAGCFVYVQGAGGGGGDRTCPLSRTTLIHSNVVAIHFTQVDGDLYCMYE